VITDYEKSMSKTKVINHLGNMCYENCIVFMLHVSMLVLLVIQN